MTVRSTTTAFDCLMTADEALEIVERHVLSRPLTPLEQLVLGQSWVGQTYSEMAQNSGYGSDYIKEVGSQLWQDLSSALGQRVTKKNCYLILSQYQPKQEDEPSIQPSSMPPHRDRAISPVAPPAQALETPLPGSPLPLHSPFYINRPPIEETAFAELKRPGCVLRIRAPRKMGKSSLLNRILAQAKAQQQLTVYIDFQETDQTIFVSLDAFLRWFCANVTRQLALDPKLDDYWDEDMGSKVSCKIYFEGYLLKQLNRPLVLALNEVDCIFEHPALAQDFLPMLRVWHEQAQQETIWQKLRLIVLHSTESYVPLRLHQSPFNVGLPIRLPQFTLEQIQSLAQCYGLDWQDDRGTQQAKLLKAMVGGHPYLVSTSLYHLAQTDLTLTELLQTAATQAGIYSHHLRSQITTIQADPSLIPVLHQVVQAEDSVQLNAIAAYKLESMGLIQLSGNQAQPSCKLYQLYFRDQLRTFDSIENEEQV